MSVLEFCNATARELRGANLWCSRDGFCNPWEENQNLTCFDPRDDFGNFRAVH